MARDQCLETARNLARYHREHEKFYARAPLEEAASLQRTSAALRALAERWSTIAPRKPEGASPFSGAEDINDERAIELAGILFMEGEGEPAEIARIKRELKSMAEDNEHAGDWLGSAMETSWAMAEALLQYPELADLLSQRHRIISNDWRAASLAKLVARNLDRARAILDKLDFLDRRTEGGSPWAAHLPRIPALGLRPHRSRKRLDGRERRARARQRATLEGLQAADRPTDRGPRVAETTFR